MKMKSIICIAAILILFVSAVNAASAGDNATSDIDGEGIPVIDVPSKVWVDGNDSMTIDSRESAALNITGAVTYAGNITSGESKIPLKNLTVGKHNIFVNYLSNTTSFQREFNLTVMKDSPYWDIDFQVDDDGDRVVPVPDDPDDSMVFITGKVVNVPEGLTGELNFYKDDFLWKRVNIPANYYQSEYGFTDFIDAGKILNLRVEYLGDDYFKPSNKTAYVHFTDLSVDIPSKIVKGYDDGEIKIESYDYRKGFLEIYIDDELFVQKEIEAYDKDAEIDSGVMTHRFSLNHLEAGKSYDIKVIFHFKNKYGAIYRNETSQAAVTVCNQTDKYVDFSLKKVPYIYGESNQMFIYAPKLDLDVKLDGKSVKYTYDGERYLVNIDDLKPGIHEISVSYGGDSLFLKNTFYKTFGVHLKTDSPYSAYQFKEALFKIEFPKDASGNLTMKIKKDNETDYHFLKTVPVRGGKVSLKLPTDHIGRVDYKISFEGNYEIFDMCGYLMVDDCGEWSLSEYETGVNETNSLTLTLPEDAHGNLTVAVAKENENFTNYTTKALKNGKVTVNLPTDHIGNYVYKTYFTGNYELETKSGSFRVTDVAKWSDISYYVKDGENLKLKLPGDATGNLTVKIFMDGEYYTEYVSALKNGESQVQIPIKDVGNYEVRASFEGNYEVFEHYDYYCVSPVAKINGLSNKLEYMSNQTVSLKLPKDGTGKLTLELKKGGDDNFSLYKSVDLVDGEASITVPTDKFESFYYRANYTGNYKIYNISGFSEIIPLYYSDGFVYIVNKTGFIDIYLDGKFIDTSMEISGGFEKIDVSYLFKYSEEGIIEIAFWDYNPRAVINEYFSLFVNFSPIFDVDLKAKDVSICYGDGSAFNVEVFRNGEKVDASKEVIIKIGSKKYSVWTDKNGVAKLKISQLPGKYTIKTTYKTKTVTNTLTVKRALTFKKVKVKKSAKKLVLTAKLAKKIKGKKITFKFNGKKYTAKTNKKGIATVTVKKSVLKKLKVGKKISCSATYIKETHNFTVKVKK